MLRRRRRRNIVFYYVYWLVGWLVGCRGGCVCDWPNLHLNARIFGPKINKSNTSRCDVTTPTTQLSNDKYKNLDMARREENKIRKYKYSIFYFATEKKNFKTCNNNNKRGNKKFFLLIFYFAPFSPV
jgi:hypothetical protein